MIKDIIIFISLSIFGFALFLSSEILIEKNNNYERKIEKYDVLIDKMKKISKIEKNIDGFRRLNKLTIFDKENAQDRVIDIFDRYKDFFGFRAENFLSKNEQVVLSLTAEKVLKNKKQSKLFAKLLELNILDGAILLDKNIKYNGGKINYSFDLILPFRSDD